MPDTAELLKLTGDIVSAFVSHNSSRPTELPDLIAAVHAALRGIATGAPEPEPVPELKPAVPIKKSVTPDYLICLEDGLKFKSMRRHLATLGMTPEEYRAKWGLPADYPMVAPNYAALRSEFARAIGLGNRGTAAQDRTSPGSAPEAHAQPTEPEAVLEAPVAHDAQPKRRGRPRRQPVQNQLLESTALSPVAEAVPTLNAGTVASEEATAALPGPDALAPIPGDAAMTAAPVGGSRRPRRKAADTPEAPAAPHPA